MRNFLMTNAAKYGSDIALMFLIYYRFDKKEYDNNYELLKCKM